jgi:hypothetical protein
MGHGFNFMHFSYFFHKSTSKSLWKITMFIMFHGKIHYFHGHFLCRKRGNRRTCEVGLLDGWHCAILDHDDFHQDIATGGQQGLDTGRPT